LINNFFKKDGRKMNAFNIECVQYAFNKENTVFELKIEQQNKRESHFLIKFDVDLTAIVHSFVPPLS
jgi:uncharacterized protein YkuJ